jgi:adenine-specific DNA-methyltransferase
MRRCLIEQNAEPFLYQALDTDSKKAAIASSGDACRTGDLAQIVLLLFGAQPFPSEQDPDRRLGQFFHAGSKTLVRVESPNVSTGMASLREAIAQRDHVAGNWDRMVVLAWKLEPSIDVIIEELNDSRLEVLSISADLIRSLCNGGDIDRLRRTRRFAATQVQA